MILSIKSNVHIARRYGAVGLLLVLVLGTCIKAYAQSDYNAWQQIYSVGSLTISVAYKEGTICSGGDKAGRYKYKLAGSLESYPSTLYVNNTYVDCNGKTQTKQDALAIGPGGALGEVESLNYTYKGKGFKNANTSSSAAVPANSQAYNPNSNSSPSSTDIWGVWVKVYADNMVTVYVRYKMSTSACAQGGLQHKYKFRIDGTLHATACELPVKLQYVTCQSSNSENNHKLQIGSGGALGEVESIDYRYSGIGMAKCSAGNIVCAPTQQQQYVPAPVTQSNQLPYAKPRRNPAMWGMWFKLGADMGTRPMVADYTYTLGGSASQSNKLLNPFAFGLRADLAYTPIYVRGFSLGINVGGAYGTGMLTLLKSKPKSIEHPSAETEGSQSYTYYKLDAGAELAFGWEKEKRAVLLIAKYQYHINVHKYSSKVTYVAVGNIGSEEVAANPSLVRETIYGGFRFKPNTTKLTMDLTFQLSRDFLWNWNIAKRVAASSRFQYGGGILFQVHAKRVSGFMFSVDIATNAIPSNSYNSPKPSGKDVFSRVNILYTVGGKKAYKHK